MVPPPGSRGPGGPGSGSEQGHSPGGSPPDKSVRCEASRNLKWAITNTGIHAPVYKLTLPNPDAPGNEQPLFQISKPNPNATFWTMFYFTYAGHLIPPKRIEFGKIQKNAPSNSGSAGAGAAAGGSSGGGGGGGTRVSITGKSAEEKAVWQTLGEGNEDMVEWIVLCAALNVLDEEIIKAAEKNGLKPTPSPQAALMGGGVPRPGVGPNGRQVQANNAVPSSRPGQGQGQGMRGGPPPPNQQGGFQRPPPQMQGRPMPPPQQMQGRPMPPPNQMQGRPMPPNQMQRPPPNQMQRPPQQQQQYPPNGQMRGPPPPQANGRRF